MRNKFVILTLIFVLPILTGFKFTKEVCRQYGLGQNWYCEETDEEQQEETLPKAKDIMNAPISPIAKAKLLNELWDAQRKTAVLTHKRQDIERFLETQHLIAERGIGFSHKVQKVIETTPRFSLHASKYKSITEKILDEEASEIILKQARNRYAIGFIYSVQCRRCHRQMPVILELKQKWGLKILGVTQDGRAFEGLDEHTVDPTVRDFPTMVLIDGKDQKKIFLSSGLTGGEKLEHLIVNRIKDNENENSD